MDKQETFKLLGKQWTLLILDLLGAEGRTWRFTDIMRHNIDLTPKVLTTRLKNLQEVGYVEKIVDDEDFAVTIRYQITEKGKKLMQNIERWQDE